MDSTSVKDKNRQKVGTKE